MQPLEVRGRIVVLRRLAAVLLLLLPAAMSGPAKAADQTLLLEVVINGRPTGRIGEFLLHDGTLLARPQELRDLGIRVPQDLPTHDGKIAVGALPGVTASLDQANQMLRVTAGDERLLPEVLTTGPGTTGPPVQSGTGVTLNYDVSGSSVSGTAAGTQNFGSGLFDLRGFSPWGVVASSALTYAGVSPRGPGTNSAIRLDSGYVYSDPESLRRYRLGDFITGGLGWTRPLRLGGVQVNTDFAMRPDLVTFPLPSVSGTAAVPSTVDLLVNGTRMFSHQVAPGPFQTQQLPVVSGSGLVSMTVTDALGRQVTTTLPFYASAALLASGLQSYSVELGAVRRNWGVISNDYGETAGLATWRRGLTPWLTAEAHAEGSSGLFMAGGCLVANLFHRAVANLSLAGSTASGHSGTQISLGLQHTGPVFSLGATIALAEPGFRDIATLQGDPVPRRRITGHAGLTLGRFGSVSLAYSGIDRDAVPAPIHFFVPPASYVSDGSSGLVVPGTGGLAVYQPAQRAHVLSASYSVQIGKVALYATGFRDFAAGGSSGVVVGLTMPLGSRSSAGAGLGSGSGGSYAQAQITQTSVSPGDWGYQAYGTSGSPGHAFGQVQYKSGWGLFSAGVDRIDGQTSLRAEAQGSVSFADGGLFAANSINDSFAIVDTGGAKGVRVLSENRVVGRTDSAGRLLVPDLHSFDSNHIAIDPTDLPVDASIPMVERDVRPQDRSGVVVRFPIRASHAALLRLVDRAGKPIPVGSTATLKATGATVPVGYDGEAYLTDLAAGNEVAVVRPDGTRCFAAFAYRQAPGDIPTIGPLTCQDQTP